MVYISYFYSYRPEISSPRSVCCHPDLHCDPCAAHLLPVLLCHLYSVCSISTGIPKATAFAVSLSVHPQKGGNQSDGSCVKRVNIERSSQNANLNGCRNWFHFFGQHWLNCHRGPSARRLLLLHHTHRIALSLISHHLSPWFSTAHLVMRNRPLSSHDSFCPEVSY